MPGAIIHVVAVIATESCMKFLLSILLFMLCRHAFAQVSRGMYSPAVLHITKPYSALSDIGKYSSDSSYYEQVKNQKEFECIRFLYHSDTLMVEGFVYKPVLANNIKYPVVFYNRGGTGNYGRIDETDLTTFYKLALNGFVVFATNYRFINNKGPYDELGGNDMQDVFSLVALAKQQAYVDTTNLFMFGISRGGMMTYQAIKQLKLNAAAVIAGPTNYVTDTARQTEFFEGWHDDTTAANENYNGLQNVLPGFTKSKEAYLRKRSAVCWADSIQTPVLILHSAKDGFVNCSQSLQLAQLLQQAKKEYALKIYSQKSHSLPFRYFDSYDEIISWFDVHKK